MSDVDLIAAAKNGNYEHALSLLTQGCDVNVRDKDNATALYWSCCRGHLQICEILIQAGCDINARVTWGSTALHAASDRGHTDCVNLLLYFHAHPNSQNNRGDTPLHLAAYRGHRKIAEKLIHAGADAFLKNDMNKTAAEEAESGGHIGISRFILNTIADSLSRSQVPVTLPVTNQQLQHNQTGSQVISRYQTGCTSELPQQPVGDRYSSVQSDIDNNLSYTSTGMGSTGTSSLESSSCSKSSTSGISSSNQELSWRSQPSENQDDETVFYKNGNIGYDDIDGKCLSLDEEKANIYTKKLPAGGTSLRRSHSVVEHRLRVNQVQPVLNQQYNHIPQQNGAFQDGNIQTFNGDTGRHFLGSYQNLPGYRVARASIGSPAEFFARRRGALEEYAESLQVKLVDVNQKLEQTAEQKRELSEQCFNLQNYIRQQKDSLDALCQENQILRSRLENKRLEPSSEPPTHMLGLVSSHIAPSGVKLTHAPLLNLLQSLSKADASLLHGQLLNVNLKQMLQNHWLEPVKHETLDTPNKEWVPGVDFVLLGEKPLNQVCAGERDGSCSLVFRIRHLKTGRNFILKMMINLINLHFQHHGDGCSLDIYLKQNFSPEYDIPVRLAGQTNIVQILHHYQGSTERFKRFISLLIPQNIDVPIEMASRTTFLVMNEYPLTLRTFMMQLRHNTPKPNYGLNDMFLIQLLYQLLSAVYFLHRKNIVHRDIKADNVFLDHCLRPVLGDFGFARSLCSGDGRPLPFRHQHEACAGNAHAWAPELSRYHNSGPQGQTNLKDVYGKADTFGLSRMFYSLLRPLESDDAFPQSSVNQPHYENTEIPELPATVPPGVRYVLRQLVLDNPADRMTARKAMLSTGVLLFAPTTEEVGCETDAHLYCQARMIKLLTVDCDKRLAQETEGTLLTMEKSVEVVSLGLEADFLCNISPEEFWEILQHLRDHQLIPS